MNVSIFTPTHDPKFLVELYDSIKNQDFYEWVIVPNNGAVVPDFKDDRVHIYPHNSTKGYVGELKNYAASRCAGDIVLEVDHDDLLTDTAVADVKKAFENPEIGFVYSNAAEFRAKYKPGPRYDLNQGWVYRPFIYRDCELEECQSFPPTPASVSRIWFAPNHLRAWRKSVYDALGGHRKDMRVLDDQELLIRTYFVTKMHHIDKCLYLYRLTGENTYVRHNAEIQNETMRLYDNNILDLAIRWSELNGLRKLDLGGQFNGRSDLENIDLSTGYDLNKTLDMPDNSVGVIRANDILEHLPDKLHIIKELYRVLAPNGYLLVMVPSALAQGAYQDPTHVAYYVENSFKYYTEARFGQYIGTPVRFQAMRLYTTKLNSDGVSWIVAHLVALKTPRPRVPGIISI